MLQTLDTCGIFETAGPLEFHTYPDDPESRSHTEWPIRDILRDTRFPNPKATKAKVKVYEPTPHGVRAREISYHIQAYPSECYIHRVLECYGDFQTRHPDIPNPCVGLCSTFTDSSTLMTYEIPMVDLEIDATIEPRFDLREVSAGLIQAGLSGFFIRSGDIGRESYHFIGDRIYRVDLSTMIGLIMTSLSTPGTE